MSAARASIFCLLGVCSALFAQAPASLHFEVASVRPSGTECRGRWDFRTSHDTLTAENAPLLRIVSRAFHLTDDRVIAPPWLESQCFDIRAKAASDVPQHDLMDMLQSLLVERFHLSVERQTEERPVFALMVDKNGPKLPKYGGDAPTPPAGDGRVLFTARRIFDLLERLGKITGRPVIDKTGLTGDYLIVFSYLPLGSTSTDPMGPASDIFSAVRDQLGLKLESQRATVEVLKIVSVDKLPSAN